MKKLCYILVIITALLFVGCSENEEIQSGTHAAQSQTATTDAETEQTTVVISEVQERWNRYEITGENPKFSAVMNANPIDYAYRQDINAATTAGECVEVQNKYISYWKKEMDDSMEQFLLALTVEDAERFRIDQENWVQTIDADLQTTNDILRGELYDLHLNLTFSQALLSEKRECYRERTIKIKYLHYLIESGAGAKETDLQSLQFYFDGDAG